VIVTFTVIAGLVTPPEEGVIMTDEVLGAAGPPEQPATTTNTSIAPAIPIRVRKRRAEGIMNSRAIASIMKITCRSNADGGTFMDCGGTVKDDAMSIPFIVVPAIGLAVMFGTEHEVINALPGVHVKDTAPVNPPSPITVTANVPDPPLATVTEETAVTEKSYAVPASGTVLTLPPVCVIVSAPVTGPGGVAATGPKVTLTMQGVPFAAITIGKLPLLQAAVLEVSAKTAGAAAIAEILSGKLPLFPIETIIGILVCVSRVPGKVRLFGVRVMLEAVPEPVPLSATTNGWFGPSSASTMSNVAETAPAIAGVKITPIVQEAPPASGVAHGVVPLAVPTKSGLVLVGGRVKPIGFAVLFVIVTYWGCDGAATS
jgi:hypothetical protein